MDFRWAEFFEGGVVSAGAVAFVDFKAVGRVFFGETGHQAVAGNFGDNGSNFNGRNFLVTSNDGFGRQSIFPIAKIESPVKEGGNVR